MYECNKNQVVSYSHSIPYNDNYYLLSHTRTFRNVILVSSTSKEITQEETLSAHVIVIH